MTSSPALDDQTITVIRDAMAEARSGNVTGALRIAERGLATGGDPVALNAMLGSLHCSAGALDAGVRHLRAAHDARPKDVVIAANLATALSELGEYQSALDIVSEELAGSDLSFRLVRMRGFFAQMLDDFPTAIAAYSCVVSAQPSDWETWNNLGNARVSSGDLAGGVTALRRAAELNPKAAPTRLNFCRALRDAQELAEAEGQLRAMADDFPEDAKPLIELHDLLRALRRDDHEVLEVLERAIEREPSNTQLVIELGRHHLEAFAMDKSEKAFRRVLTIDPANEDAFIGLMMVGEYSRPELLQELAGEAADAGLGQAALNLIRAYDHRRGRRFHEGLAALESVPPDFEAARRAHVEGQLLDAVGEHDAAFAAFSRSNELLAADDSMPLQRAARLRQQHKGWIELTTAKWIDGWATPEVQPDRPPPAFLVGFPRSGTTLLDTMLMGHPDVEVMEEQPVVHRLMNEIGGYEAIAAMDESQVRTAQERYFTLARNYADVRDGALLVDKSPLLLNRAALIHRLFPNAKFILALRHPADAVLSCFMSSFRLNSSMANFLQLETAAEFYDLTFSAWENARSYLPLSVHSVVYEDLVANTEAELRRLSDFLDLKWQPQMLDHQRTAASRGVITTASYAQVTESVYDRAVGRWQRYRKHLEPVLPVLAPWIAKFGYDA